MLIIALMLFLVLHFCYCTSPDRMTNSFVSVVKNYVKHFETEYYVCEYNFMASFHLKDTFQYGNL